MSSQLQAYFNSQQQSSSSSPLFSPNMANDSAIVYQQQQQQLHRSMSSTNQQSNSALYDDMQRSFRHPSTQSASSTTTNSSYFPSNVSIPQQQSNDIMTRLNQAMQIHGKEQRRVDPQQQQQDLVRLKLLQLAEEDQRQYKLQQELAKNRQSNLDQLSKSMENKKQQSTMDIDPFLAFQQSIQYQKEQQAKIEAQQ